MEIPKFVGDSILPELQRQIKLNPAERPLMGVLTTDPVHKGGMEYVPVALDSLATSLDDKGDVSSVTATFDMRSGGKTTMMIGAKYDLSGCTEPQAANEIRSIRALNVYCSRQ